MSQPNKKSIEPKKDVIPLKTNPVVVKKSKANLLIETQNKEFAVLQLICRFGLSTPKVASYFIDDPKGYVIRRLLKNKWISTHRNPRIPPYTKAFGAEHAVVTLTKLGLRMFHERRGEDIRYLETNRENINFRHASHTLEGQITVKKLLMFNLIREYETERMIDPDNKLGPKKFDLVAILNEGDAFGKKAGIEIELSPKYKKEMCETRKRICQSLMKKNFMGKVVYAYVFYFMEQSIMQSYQELFSSGAEIYYWHLNSKRKYVQGDVDLIIPDYLAARILFFPIQGIATQEVSQ